MLCTRGAPNLCHKHRLLHQCVTPTSMSVVAPPSDVEKAKEKRKINEMKEQAKEQKEPKSEDPKWEAEIKS